MKKTVCYALLVSNKYPIQEHCVDEDDDEEAAKEKALWAAYWMHKSEPDHYNANNLRVARIERTVIDPEEWLNCPK